MINRHSQGFIGKQGDNVYAGRDGNAYRRDQNGNWSKWDNGNWNSVQRPNGAPSTRDQFLSEEGRQREQRQQTERRDRSSASGERASQSLNRAGQMDSATFKNLERDRAGRNEGAQRTRDQGAYRSGSSSSAGSYRGGGFGGGRGGGGFRGGGR